MRLGTGDVIAGKYRVEQILGAGGMGIVVAATHLLLGSKVAVKLLLAESDASEDVVARFLREGRIISKLRSRHVTRVIDVALLDSGEPYLVMELLEGATLSAIVKKGRALAVEVAVGYLLQVCDAIAEAHESGVVHRDLKPANIFVSIGTDGSPCVKVLDFGISKVIGAEELALTKTASVLGSPSYMSPEQLMSARDVDARTDIWALGAVLYELLTGERAFHADSIPELCRKITEAPAPRARALRADVPPDLERVVLRCLEKDRDRRYARVSELAEALAPFSTAQPDDGEGLATTATEAFAAVSAAAPRQRGSRRSLRAIGALTAAALTVALAVVIRGRSDPAIVGMPAARAASSTSAAPPSSSSSLAATEPSRQTVADLALVVAGDGGGGGLGRDTPSPTVEQSAHRTSTEPPRSSGRTRTTAGHGPFVDRKW